MEKSINPLNPPSGVTALGTKNVTNESLAISRIPREYWPYTREDIQDFEDKKKIIGYIGNIDTMYRDGWGLLLAGGTFGCGKTAAACIIGKAYKFHRRAVLFVTQQEIREKRKIFEEVRDSNDKPFQEAEVLIIDGLDDSIFDDKHFNAYELEQVLRKRNSNKKPTILTSNINSDKLKDTLLASIIKEKSFLVSFKGATSFRERGRDNLEKTLLGIG
jgi:DNA replication protein DnaC